jgi:hypothetical protein
MSYFPLIFGACNTRIYDFAYDEETVYIYSEGIYKFNFDEIINGKE